MKLVEFTYLFANWVIKILKIGQKWKVKDGVSLFLLVLGCNFVNN